MRPFFKTWLTICLFVPLAAHATNREQQLPPSFNNGQNSKSHSAAHTIAKNETESTGKVSHKKTSHAKNTHEKNEKKSHEKASKHSKASHETAQHSAHHKNSNVAAISPPSMGNKQSSAVLSRAVNVLGTPYRWGGSTTKGFDCSGLVKYAFRDVNEADLPRTSNAMAEGHGQKVDRKDLKPGDLLFFNTKGHRVNHVAIYLGNDRFIHAPRRGKAVSIDSLSKPYWEDHYVLAKRVLPKQKVQHGLRVTES